MQQITNVFAASSRSIVVPLVIAGILIGSLAGLIVFFLKKDI